MIIKQTIMTKILLTLSLMATSLSLVGQTGTVLFRVYNIEYEKGGEISAGIFTEDNFPKVGRQLRSVEQAASSGFLKMEIPAVPVGTYGAVAFHDIDINKDLNTDFIGFPTEPVGFANGAKIFMGPPSFGDASVVVKEGEVTIIDIRLK